MDKHQWTTRKLLLTLSWPAVVGLGLAMATEGGGGAPTSICTALTLTELEWRAREEAVGRWGTSGGVAGVEKQRGRAGIGYDDGEAPRARRLLLRGRRAEATRKRGAAECGRALA